MDKNPNYRYCRKCGEPCTWFNYKIIREEGEYKGHEHINCEAPDIIKYKERRGL